MTLVDRILSTLHKVAPDVDPKTVDHVRPLTEQLDLDSLDYENLVSALSREYEMTIPEADIAQLKSIDDLADYVKHHAHAK
jgi:acyl carrier protein